MMRRRFEAYKDVVVRPFFRDHFARLDRQVVLVDALSAFNAGPDAVRDLEGALAAILECFQPGRWSLASALFRPRIDRILFAATKADHLHHASHERLERILGRMTERAAARADTAGAPIDVVALAAVRATREASVRRGREQLPSIIGTPAANEVVGAETFDGETEAAMFPGDLPEDPEDLFHGEQAFRGLATSSPQDADFASCGCARRDWRRSTASLRCPIYASTARCSSCSETACHEIGCQRPPSPAGCVPAR